MAGRRIKLRRAIFRLALGILLLLLSFALAAPTAAESSVLTGSFTVQLADLECLCLRYRRFLRHHLLGDKRQCHFPGILRYPTHANIDDYAYHSNMSLPRSAITLFP